MNTVETCDEYVARSFKTARERFALKPSKRNAATLLRTMLNAAGADLINDDEQEGVTFDVIEYLER